MSTVVVIFAFIAAALSVARLVAYFCTGKLLELKFENVPLYLLFAANCILGKKEGNGKHSALFWISAALTAAVAALDIKKLLDK